MMQIFPNGDQVRVVREWFGPIILPFLIWAWRKGIARLELKLNEMITANVNRIRDETVAYMRGQFQLHLDCDRAEFDALRKAMNLPPKTP